MESFDLVNWRHQGAINSCQSGRVLDCGGKRSATPLSHARRFSVIPTVFARSKAPASLRFVGAVQNLAAKSRVLKRRGKRPESCAVSAANARPVQLFKAGCRSLKVSSATPDLSSSPKPAAIIRTYCFLAAAETGRFKPCSLASLSAMPESLAAWAAEKKQA